uniref:Uncharacterized protein n=1 Tax=Oryza sativa subsp. japonica TaxID=39947 RepID=Q6K5S6_ORYSJ|nr:hypothetical protein [Oryza sativa Japonica Group]BAD22049.1 hypothetical protein [Oryza sativa Japonica Group]
MTYARRPPPELMLTSEKPSAGEDVKTPNTGGDAACASLPMRTGTLAALGCFSCWILGFEKSKRVQFGSFSAGPI